MNCAVCGNPLLCSRAVFSCSCGVFVHAYCWDKHILQAHQPTFEVGTMDLDGVFKGNESEVGQIQSEVGQAPGEIEQVQSKVEQAPGEIEQGQSEVEQVSSEVEQAPSEAEETPGEIEQMPGEQVEESTKIE